MFIIQHFCLIFATELQNEFKNSFAKIKKII